MNQLLRLELWAVALSLGACATLQSVDPGTRTVTNTVLVPVPTSCVGVEVPIKPRATRPKDGAATDQLAAAAAADAEAFEAYADAASKIIERCVKAGKRPDVQTKPLP